MIKGKIENIAFRGNGILRNNKLVIFIPYSAPQDEVTIEVISHKKNYSMGKIVQFHKKSLYRAVPRCKYYETCGGCQLQHLNYATQLLAKQRFVQDSFQRILKLSIDSLPIMPAPLEWGYRKHIQLTLRSQGKGFQAGYIQTNNTSLLQISKCPIFHFSDSKIFKYIHNLVSELSNKGIKKGTLRIFKNTNQKYIFAFTFFPQLPINRKKIIERFLKNTNQVSAIYVRTKETKEEYGLGKPKIELNGLKFIYSPFGFLQNHLLQAEQMYRDIISHINSPSSKVLDLYCGIGVTTLLLAKKGIPVLGIESNKHSIELAKENAELNSLTLPKFICSTVEDSLTPAIKNLKPNYLLVNPPRGGLSSKVLEILLKAKIEHLIYVSCDPAILARDLIPLLKAGYTLEKCQLYDMFPQTYHVETVLLLKLIKP